MLAIVGTLPYESFPLFSGEIKLKDQEILLGNHSAPIQRGTAALIAASIIILELLEKPSPFVYLIGDTGKGQGSRKIYDYLIKDLVKRDFSTIVFHYLLPDADWCNKILFALDKLPKRPFLIADAGFMYAAKMSGNANAFDLFTPDPGELAFLADEEAPHPFYTRGFLLHDEGKVEELIKRAYQHGNASRYLLVKGKVDIVAENGNIIYSIPEPAIEALEAIGGTGDTITGIVAALIEGGFSPEKACFIASKTNRMAGKISNPLPSTQIGEIIYHIPEAFYQVCKDMKNFLQL